MAMANKMNSYPDICIFTDKQQAQQFSCCVCLDAPMFDPTQTGCGNPLHCLCKKCVDQLYQSDNAKCPFCDVRLTQNHRAQALSSQDKQMAILMLKVKCNQAGCNWNGMLLQWMNGHRQTHENQNQAPPPVPDQPAGPQGNSITIKVKDVMNVSRTIKVRKTDTIKIFKDLFANEQAMPVNKQAFVWRGRGLPDDKTFQQLGIKHGSIIHYVKRFQGGIVTEH